VIAHKYQSMIRAAEANQAEKVLDVIFVARSPNHCNQANHRSTHQRRLYCWQLALSCV
jgi:hypothetical protein